MWRDFPYRSGSKPMPKVLHGMFWSGVTLVVWSIVATVAKLFWPDKVVILLRGEDITRFALPAAVVIGATLAYGIWAERVYARYLAMVVLLGVVSWVIGDMYLNLHFSFELIASAVAAIGSIRYLARNPDVIEYYTRRA